MRKGNQTREILLTNEMTVDFSMLRSFMEDETFGYVDGN